MSRNTYMHPRNIYKTPPDYGDLAVKYPEFRKICKLELDGRVSIDLKKPEVLKQLSKALLLKDFQLKVEFPENCLVPTIPLRLNYILWLEDIIKEFNLLNINGIDIGCGAMAIYSILAARKNGWKMTGIESDQENVDYATLNIKNNNLEDLIYIFLQKNNHIIFQDLLELEENHTKTFTFCICNPPFYENPDDLPENKQYGKRKAPKNISTGKETDLVCEGGEVTFVKRIIQESLQIKDKILIYTSMLGHKRNVCIILEFLRSQNIFNILQTEFCQGNTTRWGIAWTFSNELNLERCKKFCMGKLLEFPTKND